MKATESIFITSMLGVIEDKFFIRKSDCKNLFIISVNNDEQLNQSHLQWLDKVIEAIKMNSNDFSIMDSNVAKMLRISKLNSIFENIIIFDNNIDKYGIHANLPKYEFFSFNNLNILYADEISITKDDNTLKKRLWFALQSQFHVKV